MVSGQEKKARSRSSQPVVIFREYRRIPVSLSRIRSTALSLYQKEKIPANRKISLVLCSNRTICKLNTLYRKINRPTDVLSFILGDPDLLGEIYISLQQAKNQAREYQSTLDDEIKRLFVHGFFHLLGYDHMNTPDRLKMEKKEIFYR